jgi:hypothetical protein
MSPTNYLVLVSPHYHTVLAVYGSALKADAEAKRTEIEEKTGGEIILHDMYFVKKPRVGQTLTLCCYCSQNCHREACK